MMLIVDSGSTKSDWVLLSGNEVVREFKTMGFNPYFHNEGTIAGAISENAELFGIASDIEQVYYYGAGCSSEDLKRIVASALTRVFENADIKVDHDLLASALATFEGKPSIACILGTGSNSCYIDQEKTYQERPSLAYILGDEGSGSYYGKKLLSALFYKKLPRHLEKELKACYNVDKDVVFENVYQGAHANVYLASFMGFVSDHKNDPFFKEMVVNGMQEFMEIHVCSYPGYRDLPTHFVGSIGFYFEDELRKAASLLGINVGKVVRKPIDGLVKYHLAYGMKNNSRRA